MKLNRRRAPQRSRIVMLALIGCCFISSASAQDWPELRGPDGQGAIEAGGILSRTKDIDLAVRWKRELGSGCSSVVISDGRVVVLYSDGEEDQVACLSQDDGETIWTFSLGETLEGRNGSFDGPISTPVVYQGMVYALAGEGEFYAIDLVDGEQVWSRDLVAEESAPRPLYGFGTSPIVAADTVILQVGAADAMTVGFDPKTGVSKWKLGSDRVATQSPARLTFAGREVVVSAGGQFVYGIDARSGDQLFKHEHGGGNGSAVTPVQISPSTFLLTNDDGFSTAVEVRERDGKFEASSLWKNRSIKNTYNIPCKTNEHIFAYTTRILTCVDPANGQAVWKERQPGDGFMVVVDGRLVINTKEGGLHVADATADGYRELAGLKLFDDLVWSLPAYADDSIYVRSLGEVACVEIVPKGSATVEVETEPSVLGTRFEQFVQQVEAADDATAKLDMIEAYLSKQESFPIVEGDIVHFVYRGEAEDVAVASDVFGARQERKMQRLPETDFYYFGLQLPPDQRANYLFLVDYEVTTDPLNDRTITSSMYKGEMEFAVRLMNEKPLRMSWFGMSDWTVPSYLAGDSETLNGKLEEVEIPVEGGSAFSVEAYLPPKYAASDQRYPVIYIHDGGSAMAQGRFHLAVDAYFTDSPDMSSIVVFLKNSPFAPGAPRDFSPFLAEKVVPVIDEKYRTIQDRSKRVSVGQGFMCGSAMDAVLTQPETFATAAIQSPLIFDDAREKAEQDLKDVKSPVRLYLDWGRYDMFNPVENWDVRSFAKRLSDAASENDEITILGGEVNDSTDWSSWVNRLDAIVELVH